MEASSRLRRSGRWVLPQHVNLNSLVSNVPASARLRRNLGEADLLPRIFTMTPTHSLWPQQQTQICGTARLQLRPALIGQSRPSDNTESQQLNWIRSHVCMFPSSVIHILLLLRDLHELPSRIGSSHCQRVSYKVPPTTSFSRTVGHKENRGPIWL
jgi:hypothetical protein